MVLAAILAGVPCAANAQTVLTQRTISYTAALEAATVALDTCRKNGYKVTVTVVDSGGGTKVVLHDDGARPHTIENSMRKAYTSLTSGRTSGEYGKNNIANPQSVGALHLDRITTLKPDFVEGWDKRANVYFMMEDYGRSLADLEHVLALEPRHFGALAGLGTIMHAIGQDAKALVAYKRALEIDPNLETVKNAVEQLRAYDTRT
jgi:uncharacterized protein GlcG (DUF336 family)